MRRKLRQRRFCSSSENWKKSRCLAVSATSSASQYLNLWERWIITIYAVWFFLPNSPLSSGLRSKKSDWFQCTVSHAEDRGQTVDGTQNNQQELNLETLSLLLPNEYVGQQRQIVSWMCHQKGCYRRFRTKRLWTIANEIMRAKSESQKSSTIAKEWTDVTFFFYWKTKESNWIWTKWKLEENCIVRELTIMLKRKWKNWNF